MNKQEFIEILRNKLSKLPQKEVEDRINLYSEMITDKVEDGIKEEDAIKEIGDIDMLVSQIVADIPLSKIVKDKVKPKRKLSTLEIVLIVLGAPIWISILASLFAVVFSVYASMWAVVASLWSGVIALCAGAIYGVVGGGITMFIENFFVNLVIFGLGIVCVGLAILLCIGCIYTTKGLIKLTKIIILAIKYSFVKKEVGNE